VERPAHRRAHLLVPVWLAWRNHPAPVPRSRAQPPVVRHGRPEGPVSAPADSPRFAAPGLGRREM